MNDHPLESIPAFVLGILDPEEASAIERHIAVCAFCHAEAESFRRSIVSEHSVTHAQPSGHVKRQLMNRIAADIKQPPPLPPRKRPAYRQQLGFAFAGTGMMILLVIALIWNSSQTSPAPTALASDAILRQREIALVQGRVLADNRLITLITTPGTVAHSLVPGSPAPTAYAALYVHRGDQRVGVLVRDLPPAPVGHTYQLWVANESGQVSLGVFKARDDGTTELVAMAPAPVESYTDFMVTVEPAGGAITPSSAIVWQVKL